MFWRKVDNMNLQVPRLRIFAGPNGSGKSTIKEVINKNLLGYYVNADDIEKEINQYDFLDLRGYDIDTDKKEVSSFFSNSTLLAKFDLLDDAQFITFNDDKIIFSNIKVNSYIAATCADFIRHKLLEKRVSFSFETVMSSYDKIDFLKLAKKLGYRIYLYFIATDDPNINISRVKNRVSLGGHSVPKEKIIKRYIRSLENLFDAVEQSNRAYIFDNSENKYSWLCEITECKNLEMKQNYVPYWFNKYLFDKF